jgi:hypothetical protein
MENGRPVHKTKMKIKSPYIITARLLPGLKIGGDFVSLEYDGDAGGRQRYRYHIDIPAGSFSANDLKSGVGGGDLQEGFRSLLSFLGAAVESYRYRQCVYTGNPDDNMTLFPKEVVEWAYHHADTLQMLELEIEEAHIQLIEE